MLAFLLKKIAINPLIHWTSKRPQAFMAGIEMETSMTKSKKQHEAEELQIQLTSQERRTEVSRIINTALNRMIKGDEQGETHDR